MMARKKLETGLMLLAAVALSACTTSPRSEFAWDLRDHKPKPRVVVEYGPRSVNLPPVARKPVPPQYTMPQQQTRVAAATPTSKPRKVPGWYAQSQPQQQAQPAAPRQDQYVADSSVSFQWPVKGRVVSIFGTSGDGQRNDGINIAVGSGTPVHASASGTVSYCGNELKGFGNLVLIRHDNGYITAYAHVGNILVNRTDRVLAGQVIAVSGATGDVSSPQLHFEIRGSNQHPIDPRALLPKGFVLASNS